jgi:hypothetical protein
MSGHLYLKEGGILVNTTTAVPLCVTPVQIVPYTIIMDADFVHLRFLNERRG